MLDAVEDAVKAFAVSTTLRRCSTRLGRECVEHAPTYLNQNSASCVVGPPVALASPQSARRLVTLTLATPAHAPHWQE